MSNARINHERATTAHFATLNQAATNARIGMKNAHERDKYERYYFILDGGDAHVYDAIRRAALIDGTWSQRGSVYELLRYVGTVGQI